jgi:hypothetical protein
MLKLLNKENEEYCILTNFVLCLPGILRYFVQDEQNM